MRPFFGGGRVCLVGSLLGGTDRLCETVIGRGDIPPIIGGRLPLLLSAAVG